MAQVEFTPNFRRIARQDHRRFTGDRHIEIIKNRNQTKEFENGISDQQQLGQ
jgi:hypothetical protein